MSLNNYMGEAKTARRRPTGFALSLAAHGAAFFVLTHAPEMKAPISPPSEYKQVIEGHEPKLVWYRFNKDLPNVTSRSAKTNPKPLKALNRARQQIIASPKNAPERTQFVWAPAPELKNVPPLESPNLLAIRLPEPTPPKPESKPFVAPPGIQQPQTARIEPPPDAPQLEARPLPAATLPAPAKLVKQFEPPRPSAPKQAPKLETAPDAPVLEAPTLVRSVLPAPDKLVKQFIAPPKRVPAKLAEVAPAPAAPTLEASALNRNAIPAPDKLVKQFIAPSQKVTVLPDVAPAGDAPTLAASINPAGSTSLDYKLKGPVRPFSAPPSSPSSSSKTAVSDRAPALGDAPPSLAAAPDLLVANARDLNLAVVGLHPAESAALPSAASPAAFSAGPEIRKEGVEAAGDGKGIAVPDLFVRGTNEAKPDLIAQAYAAPTSLQNLRAAQRVTESKAVIARATFDADVPLSARTQAAMKVSAAPDPRFTGRDVYMMAIQMPNLTSYSGSWLMWYADRSAKEAGLAPVAPPVPHRKVDPKYIASAQSDHIEGKVQLLCVIDREGHVSAIELVRGLDPRLNQSAQEALAKWEFDPAVREGAPVEVDVLVEIPFRLAPGKPVSY